MTDQTVDFGAAEAVLAEKAKRAKNKIQTTGEIHKKMVANFNQTKEEILRLKAKRDAIDLQIKALEAKQENRKKFHEQFKKNSE